MRGDFHIIIPARYHSTRLPGKLLMDIGGRSVLERVYRQAGKAGAASVVIAADSAEIALHAQSFGAEVVMTSQHHVSGTERIAEVIAKNNYSPADIIVNVQADEPFIAPSLITQVAAILKNPDTDMATLCWPLDTPEQLINPNVVKVVRNRHGQALYFSRSPIPAHRDSPGGIAGVYRHIGLYAYRAGFLLESVKWPACTLEQYEALEQLRILWMGFPIAVEEACTFPMQDINTADDLQAAREMAV